MLGLELLIEFFEISQKAHVQPCVRTDFRRQPVPCFAGIDRSRGKNLQICGYVFLAHQRFENAFATAWIVLSVLESRINSHTLRTGKHKARNDVLIPNQLVNLANSGFFRDFANVNQRDRAAGSLERVSSLE